uniref:Ubiquitin-activating enzyme E1 C-terminal domain-containing protein n=1 Tax=Bicosoecida sp. CB-2014 TaxID=1486930 RepID=A0A7S1GCU7_9STRA|mmetsp:Transcript_2864/g.10126  ORF Transcript_2864/g.10126 Transcript_2864/m.10126 type:complete len:1120 (+) Transcript_2864:198-3557(+)
MAAAGGASESKSGLEDNKAFMDLYSRQIGAYGIEAMAKLVTMRVLIIGIKGTGIEAAKNLALAGPASITLFDNTPVEMRHLGSNFFLSESDVGKKVSSAVKPRLQELNKGVHLSAVSKLTDEVLLAHDVVLATEGKKSELVAWDATCRSRTVEVHDDRGGSVRKPAPVAFIACITAGLSGYVFSDFGPEFTVRDANGEPPVTRIITGITSAKEGVVTLLPEHEGGRLHGLDESEHDGWVEISEVKGMFAEDEETHARLGLNINHSGAWRVRHMTKTVKDARTGKERTVFDGYRIKIGDTSKLSPYSGGGTLTQVKKPIVKRYRSLSDNIVQPVAPGQWGLAFTDGAKFGRAEQLHFAFQALADFEEDNEGKRPSTEEDVADVVARAKRLSEACKTLNRMSGSQTALALDELDEDVVAKVARWSTADLQPVATFFGGIIAQEVVKLTGKYSPVEQWLHFDFFEAGPDATPTDTERVGSRYDDIISVWGKAFHDKMANARTFMVGCGALGCELLKNFALLGVGSGPEGHITTTDGDTIEVSNLNRQFLFRRDDVGKHKSHVSRAAALKMNPAVKIKSLELLVKPETETTFNDKFWESLTFVTNALDNIHARNYVDGRCVFYTLPLLESGTLGTKCNSMPIVPHLTASYTDGPQAGDDEDAIPMCTLRNFPSLIDHCIEWARAQFTDLFIEPCTSAMKYVNDPVAFLDEIRADVGTGAARRKKVPEALKTLKSVRRMVKAADGATFQKCMTLAQELFADLFRDRILNLIHNFPEDHKLEDGSPFWSGAKRFPTAAHLDLDDEVHMAFIIATANILAVNMGIVAGPPAYFVPEDDEKRNPAYFKRYLEEIPVPTFRRSSSAVATHEDEDEKADDHDDAEYEKLDAELRALDTSRIHIEPADFEKDHDANFHIDFIYSASNLRATNYSIKNASRHKCKMIAGKIIPAIATTTASATGLVMIEMLKILQGKPLEAYKESSNNLGINTYQFSEPLPPSKAKEEEDVIMMETTVPVPDGFTKWDKTVIDKGELTVQEFLDAFKEKTGGVIWQLFHRLAIPSGPMIIGGARGDDAAALAKPLKDYCLELYGEHVISPGSTYIPLEVSAALDDEDETQIKVPQLVYKFA